MKNIHILPTSQPSRLWTNNLRRRLELDEFPSQYPTNIAKQIYITNSEEIKEGDWFYVKTANIYGGNIIAKCLGFGENCWSEHILTDTTDEKGYHLSHCVKIILTTDQSLDGVQAIDDEFLEWFVQNPSCEEVETYSLGIQNNETGESCHYKYEIIIPKEEPKQEKCNYCENKGYIENHTGSSKIDCFQCSIPENQCEQETLEEVRMVKRTELYNSILSIVKQIPRKEVEGDAMDAPSCAYELEQLFIKWQAERMYSEEEKELMIKIFHSYWFENNPEHEDNLKEWELSKKLFEQFKKKT